MVLEYIRRSVPTAIVAAGLLVGGTAVAQMAPYPAQSQQRQDNTQMAPQYPSQTTQSGQEVTPYPGQQPEANPQATPQHPGARTQNGQWGQQEERSEQSEMGQQEGSAQPVVLIDPGKIYNASDPTSWVGKSVVLKNVTVQDTNDTGNFWVGSDGDHRLLVVKVNNPNLESMRFHKGDVVTIQGIVHPASKYMGQQTTASSGSMSDAQGSSGVFLMANSISITSSTQH